MSPLRQQLHWWSNRLGWAGVAATALLLYALLSYGVALLPAQQQLSQLEQEIADEQRRASRQQAKTSKEAASSQQARLHGDFPQRNEISKTLNKIYTAAHHSALTLQRGEYSLKRDSNTPFLRYEIELPVQGRYTAIQRFANRALKENPTLALDEISFKRETASDPLVQAKLRFTLYLRGQ